MYQCAGILIEFCATGKIAHQNILHLNEIDIAIRSILSHFLGHGSEY
jgi:hypothetical protein